MAEQGRKRRAIRALCQMEPDRYTARELAGMFVVSMSRVRRIAQLDELHLRRGVKPGYVRQPETDRRVRQAVAECPGYTVRMLRWATGLSAPIIRQSLKRQELPPPERPRPESWRAQQVAEYVRTHPEAAVRDIARALGLRSSNVSTYLARLGLRVPDARRKHA